MKSPKQTILRCLSWAMAGALAILIASPALSQTDETLNEALTAYAEGMQSERIRSLFTQFVTNRILTTFNSTNSRMTLKQIKFFKK